MKMEPGRFFGAKQAKKDFLPHKGRKLKKQ